MPHTNVRIWRPRCPDLARLRSVVEHAAGHNLSDTVSSVGVGGELPTFVYTHDRATFLQWVRSINATTITRESCYFRADGRLDDGRNVTVNVGAGRTDPDTAAAMSVDEFTLRVATNPAGGDR